jgi:class 3 adenylate cyclase
MSGLNDKIHATAVITDIRNFSETFKNFQNADSTDFLEFLELYYASQNTLATILSDDFHMSSSGDGILTIFMSDDHHKNGYAFVLASHKMLNKLCYNFVGEHHPAHISFGMGADSGNVWNVGEDYLNTYVGTVINRAARIEALTKSMANTTTAVGNSLYKSLIKEFYPTTYKEMKGYKNYDELLNKNPKSVLLSKHFMLQYAMDMPLKGVQKDAPIFRMSDSLVANENSYWNVMSKLVNKEKLERLKEFI